MLFQELTRVRHNAMHAELTARGLGDLGAPMILFVLKHRGQEGEIPVQRELADILHVSPATIAVSLKSLERGGYVEKRADSSDARRKRIALTPKGSSAMEMCAEVFQLVDERMFHGLAEEETGQLVGYLKRMLQNLRDGEDRIPCERTEPICSKN
jgi:DNA-binding MarR family transcriptional regulator